MDDLIPCLQGTGDGSQLPQLIDYLAHNPRITLDTAQQDFLAEQCVNSGIRSGTHALGNYLMYRVIAPHRKLFKKPPQGFTGYRYEFYTNPQTGETIQPYQVESLYLTQKRAPGYATLSLSLTARVLTICTKPTRRLSTAA